MTHQKKEKREAKEEAVEMLKKVKIAEPEKVVEQYPFELSGGMRQRVLIAMALSSNPDLMICDEPTTYLDTTIQAQILTQIDELKRKSSISMLYITHNLGVVAHLCEKVAVMYAGKIIEISNTHKIFKNPAHPYTKGLFLSIPNLTKHTEELPSIPGFVPDMIHMPSGCAFHPRCSFAMEICKQREPEFFDIEKDHKVACWLYADRNFGGT
jgi:oligopeptide/dipeptide ABC transporter ATP-binding protein